MTSSGPRARCSPAREASGVPDWCFNTLRVLGDDEQLTELREAAFGPRGDLDFERIDPTPPELLGRRPDPEAVALASLFREAEAKDPYSWRLARWGCGSPADPDSVAVEDAGEGALCFRLSTPWSPPGGIAATLAARFPALSVRLAFFQPALGFAGAVAFERGEEVSCEASREPGLVRERLEREFGTAEAAELLDALD